MVFNSLPLILGGIINLPHSSLRALQKLECMICISHHSYFMHARNIHIVEIIFAISRHYVLYFDFYKIPRSMLNISYNLACFQQTCFILCLNDLQKSQVRPIAFNLFTLFPPQNQNCRPAFESFQQNTLLIPPSNKKQEPTFALLSGLKAFRTKSEPNIGPKILSV